MTSFPSHLFRIGDIFRRKGAGDFYKIVDVLTSRYGRGRETKYEYVLSLWYEEKKRWRSGPEAHEGVAFNYDAAGVLRYFEPVDRLTILVLGLFDHPPIRDSNAGFLTDEDYF